MAEAIVIRNKERLDAFGQELARQFADWEKDRKGLEEQWLKNLRQYKGQYDPDIERNIPSDRSKAYPKVTRVKVNGTISRLMEMLFPQTEKNWGLEPSPLPTLKQEDLQAILDQVTEQNPGELDQAVVDQKVVDYAKEKCTRMAKTIEDQLAEQEYVALVKSVLFSGGLYGVGRLCGPFVKRAKTSRWKYNSILKRYEAFTEEKLSPYFEAGNVWNWYPDLAAKNFDQSDGYFEREIHSRAQVRALADRVDYMGERVKSWLENNKQGNYKERWWEVELRAKSTDRQNVTNLSGRKYESFKWWGFVPGDVLVAAGVDLGEKSAKEVYEATVHVLGTTVVKCILNPYDRASRPEHIFVYGEDDTSLTGEGIPQTVRDSQLGIAHAARMVLDNGSVVAGPNLMVRLSRLAVGQSTDIHANKVWLEDPNAPESSAKLVENVQIDSHIDELVAIIKLFMEFADTETALPPPALGDVSQGGSEALRTKTNASMFLGAAALPIRDTVRNFDRFTRSVIGSLYDWNMEFNSDPAIKGDYNVIARGSTSLIAKEVRAQGLDYLAATIRPNEEVYLNDRKFLEARMKVRDLELTEVLETEDEAKRKIADRAAQAQREMAKQEQLVVAQVKDLLSKALKNAADARAADVGTDVNALKTIFEGLINAIDSDRTGDAGAGGGGSSGSGAKRTASAG